MAYIIPTINAGQLVKGAPISDFIGADLRKAVRISQSGPEQHENIVWVHPAAGDLSSLVRIAWQWMDRWQQLGCPIAVDVETSSTAFVDCKLYSISLSGVDGMNTAVAFTLMDLHSLTWEAERVLIGKMTEILADPRVPKVFHNAAFDRAVIMRKGWNITGQTIDTMALAHLIQPDGPKDLGWIGHTYLDVEPWKLNHDGRKQAFTKDVIELLIYNAKDALNTGKLVGPMTSEIYARGMNDTLIAFQSRLAELATTMELRGIPIRESVRKKKAAEAIAKMDQLRAQMREQLGWSEFTGTPAQVREALYDEKFLGLPIKNYTETSQLPSTSYHHLMDYIDKPFVQTYIDYTDLKTAYSNRYKPEGGKMNSAIRSFGTPNADDFQWLYPKWGATGQKGSRFSSSPNCFDAETEVLTEDGWLKFPEAIAIKDLQYAQYDQDSACIDFVYPIAKHRYEGRELLQAKGQQVDLCATSDHRLIMREYSTRDVRAIHTKRMDELPQHLRFIHAGTYAFGTTKLEPAFCQLLVAIQADGHWTNQHQERGYRPGVVFDFNKESKYLRLLNILDTLGISYTEKNKEHNAKHRFTVYVKVCRQIDKAFDILGPQKLWGSYLLSWHKDTVTILLSELVHWDGRNLKNREMYYCKHKCNVDWLHVLCVLSGIRSTVIHAGTCWRLTQSKQKVLSSGRVDPVILPGVHAVYCVTVPKGNIIVRRSGRAVVVKNCQNWPSYDLDMIEAPPGYSLVFADKDQLELRIVACLAGVQQLIDVINSGKDPHRFSAENVYGDQFLNATPAQQKKLRDLVKNVVYAAIYNAGPKRIFEMLQGNKKLKAQVRAALTKKVIAHIHGSFFGKFVEIPMYHDRNFRMAQDLGYNEIQPFGRRRYFSAQPPPFTEVGSWSIQTTGSDFVGLEMCQIQDELYERFPFGEADIICHWHDALLVLCKDAHAPAVVECVQRRFGRSELIGPKGPIYLTSEACCRKNGLQCKYADTPWPT